MTVLIDHNAKAAEYDRLADTIAKDLIPWRQDTPRFASQLIRNGTVNLLMMIASIFDKPIDDILKDRDTVAELANAAFILYFSVSDPLPGTTIASYSYRIAGARIELASGG